MKRSEAAISLAKQCKPCHHRFGFSHHHKRIKICLTFSSVPSIPRETRALFVYGVLLDIIGATCDEAENN